MTWFWIFLALLAGAAGLRYLAHLRSAASRGGPPRVDDDALRRILEDGTLSGGDEDDEPLDPKKAARAEEEFWAESWDEPEEYHR
ncbi:MAG: hypothetical protein AB1941_10430 [Gemmatimonadota bacterium]